MKKRIEKGSGGKSIYEMECVSFLTVDSDYVLQKDDISDI